MIEEFFRQGDIEKSKNQQVSMYCDRQTTDVAKSQAGFIRMIVLPLYEVICYYFESKIMDESCLDQLKSNLSSWEWEMSRKKLKTVIYSTENSTKNSGSSREETTIRRTMTQKIMDGAKALKWDG